jgi:hypothetical protein
MEKSQQPRNVEAERQTLGALLIDPEAIKRVRFLDSDDFFIERHQWIYNAILSLHSQNEPVDPTTVGDQLQESRRLDAIGGMAYLTELTLAPPSALHAESYARIVKRKSEQRRMIRAADWLAKAAFQEDTDARRSLASKARERLQDLETEWQGGAQVDLFSADDILKTEWPEPVWAIPELLPAGLTILAGKPKLGKSWLSLQIAQAVAAGGRVLDEEIEAGPVLYLALEDPPRRLKARMQKQHWPGGLPADFMTVGHFMDKIGDLRNGGGHILANKIQENEYRLVVIDTLSRTLAGADQNDTGEMTMALTPIQEMAHEFNCAVILVDHHRKGFGSNADAVGDILGSTAKGAMADCVWGLYRERGKSGAKLAVTGRDIVERTLEVKMDWLTGCWHLIGEESEIQMTERRREIVEALAELGPSQLMDVVDAIDRDKSNTYRRMQDLVNNGFVRKYTEDGKTLYEAL